MDEKVLPKIEETPDTRERAYKFVAWSAVTFSVVAIISVTLTLPMVYNYVSQAL